MTFTAMQLGDDVEITVSITRHYGPLSITLGVAARCEVLNDAARERAINEMTDTLMIEHKRQVDRLRPTEGRPAGPPSSGNKMSRPAAADTREPSETTRRFPADFIDIEEKSGKRYYKIAGGNFLRYGVRVWIEDEEVMSNIGETNWARLPTGRHPIEEGWVAIASMAGRKPVKVIDIVPDDVEF